jgi:NAD-dependent deacetylase
MEDLIQRAAEDLIRARYRIALTGAGISTESGIPDFRGPDGMWTKNPEAEKKAYEVYDLFRADPKRFWNERLDPAGSMSRLFSILGEIGKVQPNPGHYALAEYHGGINKFRCVVCNRRYGKDELDLEKIKMEGKLPPYCQCGGVIKDDGVFFGEPIPTDVLEKSQKEAWKCDLMLICGTSAVVYPFAGLPEIARPGTIIIEINAEPTPLSGRVSDYLIQGKTGEILPEIVERVRKIHRLKGQVEGS